MRIIIVIVIVIVVAMGLGFWLYRASDSKLPEDLPGVSYEIQGAVHIAEGSIDHPAYNSNPPTSGWHWPKPAACGVYQAPLPDERLLHNLEHGGIWISYLPDSIPDDDRAKLEDFARRFNNVLVLPRPQNDANIALAAWGRLLKLKDFDEPQILGFIRALMDKGPEKVGCAHQ